MSYFSRVLFRTSKAIPFVVALTATLLCAAPATNSHYYRPRNSAKPRPRQVAAPPVVVNAASYLPGISPGGIATIFGQNLSSVTDIVTEQSDPLPLELAGIQVTVNGVTAPLFSVAFANGEDQISFQVPYETPTGLSAAQIEIFNYGNSVGTIVADSFTEDSDIFLYDGNYAVAVRYPDYTLIGPDNPAHPGDILTLYTTGLGPLSIGLTDGFGAPSDPLAYTVDPFEVTVNGEQCQVLFSGLAPGFVGLDQINLTLPIDLPPGNLDIQISSQYAISGVATLPVN
jgi:minor extracellular serine protease Vpr